MMSKTILWVDDDKELMASFKPLLESEGWKVDTATSAEQGKIKVVENKPDLIIMDVIMGGEHGYAAVEELKGTPELADIPVIVFSGVTEQWGQTTATREDALLSEAEAFIDKSSEPIILIQVIRKLLKG